MKDYLLEIPSDNPFKNDCFEREILARNFMKIFDYDKNGIILSIDSSWGTGKTTFIKMWEALIKNDDVYKEKYETLYFNAWDSDYMDDPLLAILTEVEIDNEEGIKKCFRSFLEGGKKLASTTKNILIKLSTAGALGAEDIKFRRDDLEKEYPEIANYIGTSRLNIAVESKKIRELFKENLENTIKESDKNIIFFIDELDRCKPKFAIELLESIKHLFSMKGVIFVVSLDKEQLGHSIANIYGRNMDTEGYLRRFFDYDFKLPSPDKIKYFNNKFTEISKDYEGIGYFEQFISAFIKEYNFSLRDIDKLIYQLKFILPLITEFKRYEHSSMNKVVKSYLYAYLISLKIKRPILYKKIMDVDYDKNEESIISEFEINKINSMNLKSGSNCCITNDNLLDILKEKVIISFLLLANLAANYSADIYENYENERFLIRLNNNGNYFNMVDLFNQYGECRIKSNLEFMNNVEF